MSRSVRVGETRLLRIAVALAVGIATLSAMPAIATSCGNTASTPGWLARENAKVGDISWDTKVSHAKYSGSVEGWFDKVSVTCGESIGLHLSGNNRATTLKIYRMGYYQGNRARLIYAKALGKVVRAAAPNVTTAPTLTVSTDWATTTRINIDSNFPTGIYMARFDDGAQPTYAPFVVRANSLPAPLVFIASVMTWQAYNTWGGWSLYHGPNTKIYNPARIVSFDRPYDRNGMSNYIYDEAGLVQSAESAGLDVAYATDNDIALGKTNLQNYKAVMFGGHSEYWSTNMESAILTARNAGVNILFFGGNQAYWRARLENNGRNIAVWKSDPLDPDKTNPNLITNKWGAAPNPGNQSTLLGALSAGYGVTANYRVRDGNTWPIVGSGLATGSNIIGVVGNEVDTTDEGAAPGVQTFLTSQVTLKKKTYNVDMTYYTTSSNSGVIDVSTNGWVCSITANCPWTKIPVGTSQSIREITQSLLREASKGPLGLTHRANIDVVARTTAIQICDLVCQNPYRK